MHFEKKRTSPYRFRRLTALLMALVLFAGGAVPCRAEMLEWLFGGDEETAVPASSEIATPAPVTPAPTEIYVKPSSLEDDGMLRVYLKSLEDPQQLHITLSGSYAVEGDGGFFFDRDARLTFSAVDGQVYMAVAGLTINMGPSVTLTRHAVSDGGENGIRIDESEKRSLYAGDLKVTAHGDALIPVLKIHIEDYLLGVVAYEMSDSFPIEALKAQAVAARTYALDRKWGAGRKEYDVVDTTADQVYKGYIADYVNVIEAVKATEGVVGMYDGGFATCYYTASNGGQTALASHIWGGTGSDGYLGMTIDPYDIENPSSLQNEIVISETCGGSAALRSMLMAGLSEVMSEKGVAEGDWTFEVIENIVPADPRFEGSLMCDSLSFTVRVRVNALPEPEATAQNTAVQDAFSAFSAATAEPVLPLLPFLEKEETHTMSVEVKLSVFDQIKDGLSLGLNGTDYEVIAAEAFTDETGANMFRIAMRRYGHGVGMSQRGAQQMAGAHGKSWMEILNFYYPGMSVEKIEWPAAPLTAVEALPDNVGAARPLPTPTPTPAPLPPLKDGEYYARVVLETKSSFMNVRERPTTSSKVVNQLSHGQRLIISSEPDENGWVSIHTAECAGYAKLEYLQAE